MTAAQLRDGRDEEWGTEQKNKQQKTGELAFTPLSCVG
jgi:hypothetical protein